MLGSIIICSPFKRMVQIVHLESFCEMAAKTADIMGTVKNIGIGSDLCLKSTRQYC